MVTGGGTGLGLGIASALARAGARVVITGRRGNMLEDARTRIGTDRCVAVAGDVTVPIDRQNMLAAAKNTFGADLTILVNNAGVHLKKPAVKVTDDEFQAIVSTHVNAGFSLAREAYPQMIASGRGSVIFLASMTTYLGIPEVVAYTAAKCAVAGLTRSLAAEWSSQKVRVNAIAPGWIESPMMRKVLDSDPARKEKILGRTPMGIFGQPEDIGHAVVFLCSPAARFVNGIVLPVDGGALVGF